MDESLQRLIAYVKEMTATAPRPVVDESDLRQRLGVSAQIWTNWKKRGISKEGALAAEELWGCSPTWLLTGTSAIQWPLKEISYYQFIKLSDGFHQTVDFLAAKELGKSVQVETHSTKVLSPGNNEGSAPAGSPNWIHPEPNPMKPRGKSNSDAGEDAPKRGSGAL